MTGALNDMKSNLPPGQREVAEHRRFGLPKFANRIPDNLERIAVSVTGAVENEITITDQLLALAQVTQMSDLHCVTTWSARNLEWQGVKFTDFYQAVVVAEARPMGDIQYVVFSAEDGYASCMHIDDLMADDVLLATSLNDKPMGFEFGGALRLVAPAHYGYKSIKYISRIELCHDLSNFRFPKPYPAFMNHPRGRVAYEERASYVPNWLIRPIYRWGRFRALRSFGKADKRYRSSLPIQS